MVVFFQDAADSEELCEDALRCEGIYCQPEMSYTSSSHHVCCPAMPSRPLLPSVLPPRRSQHTVVVLVAALFAARADRMACRASIVMVGSLST